MVIGMTSLDDCSTFAPLRANGVHKGLNPEAHSICDLASMPHIHHVVNFNFNRILNLSTKQCIPMLSYFITQENSIACVRNNIVMA